MMMEMEHDETDEKDLFDILPEELANDPRCFDSRRYLEWERDVATPALEAMGYRVSNWRTTDGDSFGPLVRGVTLKKDGHAEDYFYG